MESWSTQLTGMSFPFLASQPAEWRSFISVVLENMAHAASSAVSGTQQNLTVLYIFTVSLLCAQHVLTSLASEVWKL